MGTKKMVMVMEILDPLAHCDVHSIGGEMTMGRKPVKSYNYFYY